jgi:hypothetical protein
MRQRYVAKVRGFERKRYYIHTGLPYSTIYLQDVKTKSGESVEISSEGGWCTEIRYSQALHDLEVKRGCLLEFTAEIDAEAVADNRRIVFKRPSKYAVLDT